MALVPVGKAPGAGIDCSLAGTEHVDRLEHRLPDAGVDRCLPDSDKPGRAILEPEKQRRRVRLDGRHWQPRSEEHTSELQPLMRISYAVFCLTKKKQKYTTKTMTNQAKTYKHR